MSYYRYPVNKIGITSDYGNRDSRFHYGLDLGWMDYQGENIYSIWDGEIIEKSYSSTAGYYVTIKHNGNDKSKYLHLREPSFLNVGDIVSTGTHIGYMGATGNATGVHLHIEVIKNGSNVDPKTALYVYPDQIVSNNTKNNYNLLYYVPTPEPEPIPDDIEVLKKKLIEKENEINMLKQKISEIEKFKFIYYVTETAKYKIKLNKGENLLIK